MWHRKMRLSDPRHTVTAATLEQRSFFIVIRRIDDHRRNSLEQLQHMSLGM